MLDLLPDLCDHYPNDITVVETQFNHYGRRKIFYGQAITVKCFEDNSKVKEQLSTPGKGKVLVVDGEASLRRALIGDLIAESAMNNQWAGVVVNGAIRDVATINTLDIGIKALGAVPLKTDRKGLGELNVDLIIQGTLIRPGDWIYADENGVVVAESELTIVR